MRRSPVFAMLFTAAALTSAMPAVAQTIVQSVEVNADLDAIRNVRAASHWVTLPLALETAIAARLVGRTNADEGADIIIDIDTVSLANSLEAAAGVAQSVLTGNVVVRDSPNDKAYTLTISFDQAGPFFVQGTDLATVTADSQEYYEAMINAFADHVVRELD